MKICTLALIFVLLSCAALYPASVSDFAPLQVGNTWKYRGYSVNYDLFGYATSDSILRTLVVASRISQGNAFIYTLTVHDSLFSRYGYLIPGCNCYPSDTVENSVFTVSETQDRTLGDSNAVPVYFYRHAVPDSVISGTVSIGVQNHPTFSVQKPIPSAFQTSTTYARDIGMITYSYSKCNCMSPGDGSLKAVEFNGVPLGNFTVVGILDKSRNHSHLKPVGSFSPQFESILETNRNALGRVSIRKNLPSSK